MLQKQYSAGLTKMVLYFEKGWSYHKRLMYQYYYSYSRHQFTFKVDLSKANTKKVNFLGFLVRMKNKRVQAACCINQDVHIFVSFARNVMSSTILQQEKIILNYHN